MNFRVLSQQPVGIINLPSNIIARIREIFRRNNREVYVAAIKAVIAGGVIDSLRPTSRFVKCFIPVTPPACQLVKLSIDCCESGSRSCRISQPQNSPRKSAISRFRE